MAMIGTMELQRSAHGAAFALDIVGNSALRLWVHTGLLLLAMAIPTLVALAIDERLLNGANVWSKPLKFQLSVSLHLFTLAVLAALLAERVRGGRLLRATAWISAAMAILEIGYITLQAGRGRASHFNADTPLEAGLYAAMGIGAVTLVAASAVVGILLLRAPRAGIGPGLRWGGALGLIVGSVATLAVAGYLSTLGGHWIGGVASDAGGLPITGWSTSGGDIRVSHFFATHMMQGLPLVGFAADRLGRDGRTTAVVACGLWVAVVVGTFLQALLGQPLLG